MRRVVYEIAKVAVVVSVVRIGLVRLMGTVDRGDEHLAVAFGFYGFAILCALFSAGDWLVLRPAATPRRFLAERGALVVVPGVLGAANHVFAPPVLVGLALPLAFLGGAAATHWWHSLERTAPRRERVWLGPAELPETGEIVRVVESRDGSLRTEEWDGGAHAWRPAGHEPVRPDVVRAARPLTVEEVRRRGIEELQAV